MKKYLPYVLLGTVILISILLIGPMGHAQAGCVETSPDNHECTDNQNRNINTGDGNDTVDVDNGATTRNISTGDGDDTVNNDGSTRNINGQDGDDTLTNDGSANTISGGDGDDTLTNNGSANNLNGQNGDDIITNDGTVNRNINGGNQDDIITNNGTVNGTVNGGGGNDTLTNNGTVNGTVNGGGGNDTLTNNGTANNISDSGGNDDITNNGTVNNNINAGNGHDTVTNNGSANNVTGGNGNDTLTNNGTVDGSISGGRNNDEITNCGTVGGNVNGNDGRDTVTICGDDASVEGRINGGSGNDTLIFEFSSTDQDELDAFENALNAANPTRDSVNWRDEVFNWVNFEKLQSVLSLLTLIEVTNAGDGTGAVAVQSGSMPAVLIVDPNLLNSDVMPLAGPDTPVLIKVLLVNRFGPTWLSLASLGVDPGTPLTVQCLDANGSWVDHTSPDERLEDNGAKLFVNLQQHGVCGVFTVDTWADDYDG